MYQSIAVIGLGYVGFPLALTFSRGGYRVVGIDLDKRKLGSILQGKSYIPDINDEAVKSVLESGRFTVTDNYSIIAEVDAIVICVPTPLNERDAPDLSYLLHVGNTLKHHIRREQLIILESSTYPGTTKEILTPLLEQGGLTVGKDFFIGYSPERIDPGNHHYSFQEIPKIISGVTEACTQKVYELYRTCFDKVVKVSSTEVAEMAKLLENSYRFVNISFINEFAILCDQMKIDAWEVIEAAGSKPYGFAMFFPGPGIGGHCIPVDPLYLQWKANQIGMSSTIIKASEMINNKMPAYLVEQLKANLSANTLEGFRLLIVGITYKKDINDIRESSVVELMKQLIQERSHVFYHDPYVPEFVLNDNKFQSIDLTEENLSNVDCVIIATEHSQLPIPFILEHSSLVYDTRNSTKGFNGKAKIIRLGSGQ